MITVKEERLLDNIPDFDVILMPMGINNAMNQGFLFDIADRYPQVRESENNTPYGDKRKYGTVHCTETDGIIFASCYIHNGGYKKDANGAFLNMEALKECLQLIKKNFSNKKIASPILGVHKCDGNGVRQEIIDLITEYLNECDITLFDFPQPDTKGERYREKNKLYKSFKAGQITYDEWRSLSSTL